MYSLLPQGYENVIGLRIQDQLNKSDTKILFPFLATIIQKHGNLRLLLELENFNGIEVWTLFRIIKFASKYRTQIYKIAIVTSEPWVEGWIKFFSLFLPFPIFCFPDSTPDEGWNWVST